MILRYKRAASSPWMAMPTMSRRSVQRWLMLGAYHCFEELVGEGESRIVFREA